MDAEPASLPPQSTAITLLYLPDEIIILILQFLRPALPLTTFPPRHSSTASYSDLVHTWTNATPPPWPLPAVPRSLYTFALVCKRAHRLVTPLLYNAVALQTIDITNRLALVSPSRSSLIKHISLPHDGLIHSSSDRLAGSEAWTASWRGILEKASRLESLFVVTRPGGKALQELARFSSGNREGSSGDRGYTSDDAQHRLCHLRRLTISSLSFSPPVLEGHTLQAPHLTHLHLIQYVPRTLESLLGVQGYQSLRSLRLSRVNGAAICILAAYAIQDTTQGPSKPLELFTNSVRCSTISLLSLLCDCIERSFHLDTIVLELVELSNLDLPEGLTLDGPSRTIDNDEATFGTSAVQYRSGGDNARMKLWSDVLQAKELFTRYSSMVRGPHHPPIEFRIVAPRSGGWDRNESLIDFHANAAACRGDADRSAFMDEDVFELVKRYPYLGHDYGYDASGNRVAYWTGALPMNKTDE